MNIFIHINLLIIVTYVLFALFQKIETFLNIKSIIHIKPPAILKLRIAQILLVSSIMIPFAMKLLPVERNYFASEIILENIDVSERLNNSHAGVLNTVKQTTTKINEINNSFSNNTNFNDIVVLAWILGLAIFILNLLKNYLKLKNIVANSMLLKKKSKIRIVINENIIIPFSLRLFNSFWVILPISVLNNETDKDLIIKHELQHHRHGDTTWAQLIELFICLFYVNPAIYFWKTLIIELQELSCDEKLAGHKSFSSHDYISCLLRVAQAALVNRQMYAGTTSMAAVFKNSKYFKSFLQRRIEMIMEEKRSKRKWISVCTGVFIVAMTATIAYGVEKISIKNSKDVNDGNFVGDLEIQKIADESLKHALKETKAIAGFVLVSDPVSGKILAVSNTDTKNLKKGHWALAELISSASFAKTFVIAQAIEDKITNPKESHSCESGQYKYNDRIYYDWKKDGWKKLSTSETLALSSDICSIKIAEKLGSKKLEEMIENFGYGKGGTAKDFPEARIGETPELGEQFIPRVALGHAFRSTPIEIMQAYGAIANGGNLMKPIYGNTQKAVVLRRVLSEQNALTMKKMLQDVVLSGTAEKAISNRYTTAGKTASARLEEYRKSDWPAGDQYANFAGFIGFAPVSNPKVQVFVGLINPNTDKIGAHGGWHAAPVFKEVTENILSYLKVSPDKI